METLSLNDVNTIKAELLDRIVNELQKGGRMEIEHLYDRFNDVWYIRGKDVAAGGFKSFVEAAQIWLESLDNKRGF